VNILNKEEFLQRFENREKEPFTYGDFCVEVASNTEALVGMYHSKKTFEKKVNWSKYKCSTVARYTLK
jgi:hypothetical protein